jgi:hypothetical protein
MICLVTSLIPRLGNLVRISLSRIKLKPSKQIKISLLLFEMRKKIISYVYRTARFSLKKGVQPTLI